MLNVHGKRMDWTRRCRWQAGGNKTVLKASPSPGSVYHALLPSSTCSGIRMAVYAPHAHLHARALVLALRYSLKGRQVLCHLVLIVLFQVQAKLQTRAIR